MSKRKTGWPVLVVDATASAQPGAPVVWAPAADPERGNIVALFRNGDASRVDAAIAGGDRDAIEHEFGDVLFSVANMARKRGIDPEAALRKANARFERRFNAVETQARTNSRAIDAHTPDELDAMWNAAKARGL